MTISAGRLEWDVDVRNAEETFRKVEDMTRKMREAMNLGRGGKTIFDEIGGSAERNKSAVDDFRDRFSRLQSDMQFSFINSEEYTSGLSKLRGEMVATAAQTNLTGKEYRGLASLMKQVEREHTTLGGATAETTNKTRLLVAEAHKLRNRWQETGEATEETKAHLRMLLQELRDFRLELEQADGGLIKNVGALRQLNTAGRSIVATLDGMEGRISRLGLASQVQLGVTQQLQSAMYGFGPAGRVAAGALGVASGGMETLTASSIALGGAFVGVAALLTGALRTGLPEVRAFQQALRVMIADGNDLTESGLAQELERIRDAAGAAGDFFSRSQMAVAMSELVKAGVDAADAMHLLAPGMQLATITGDSLNDTTTRLLANLRQFGLDATDATRAADALARADLLAANSAKDLSEGLAVVGPIAAAAGITFEDTLGILIELDNKGMHPANVGATALRGTLSALLDPSDKARATLDRLGVSLRDNNGKARPLLDVLNDLQRALRNNEEGAQAAAEIFNTRAVTAILNMSDKSNELTEALTNSEGAMARFVDTLAQDNLGLAEQARKAAWEDLASTLAITFTPALTSAATATSDFIREIDRLGNLHDESWWEKLRQRLSFVQSVFGLDASAAAEHFMPPPPASGGRPRVLEPRNLQITPKAVIDSVGVINDFDQSLTELIARARVLKTTLDAAATPEAWLEANAAVEAFKGSSDQAAQAWQAVVSTMRGQGRNSRGKSPAEILNDLTARMRALNERSAAFGDTIEARTDMLRGQVSAIDTAVNELINAGVNHADNRIQNLIAEQARLRAELVELTDPAADAKRWVARLREELARGIKDAGAVFDLLNPRFQDLQEEARDALRDFGFDSIEYQAAITKLEALTGLLSTVETELEKTVRAKAERNRALLASVIDSAALRGELRALAESTTAAVEEGSLEGLRSLEAQIVKRLEEIGDDPSGAPLMGLVVQVRRAIEAAEAEVENLARQKRRNQWLQALVDSNELKRDLRQLGIEAAKALEGGTMEELQEFEARLVDRLTELADDPSAAPLMGLLVRLRLAIREAEEEARNLAQAPMKQALVAAQRATGAARVEARALGRTIGQAVREGNLEALEGLEAQIVETLQAVGDDPSAAPLMGLLTGVRAELRSLREDSERAAESMQRLMRNLSVGEARADFRSELVELGASIAAAIETGALDELQKLEERLVERLTELGDDPSAAPLAGLLARTRVAIGELGPVIDAAAGANVKFVEAQLRLGQATEADLVPALREQEAALVQLMGTVEYGSSEWVAYASALASVRERTDSLTQVSVRDLQAQIQHLIASGFDPASEAVQEFVRRINELQLAAALEELRSKGVANLSAFAKEVLRANGILPAAVTATESLTTRMRSLAEATGNAAAAGLADFIDGLKQVREAGGDAEEVVKGLTLAVNGAATAIQSLSQGDTISTLRSLFGLAGQGIGELANIPGLGALATGVFDLGHQIVLAISDLFTGDSPAARAIREGLTPAVAGAFSTGIMQALRGQEDWRDALEGNVKEAFLGALIQAFVNSAIIGAVLEPLITQFSKLLSRGQYDQARDFLARELPAALNIAMDQVDAFVGALPPGLLPGAGGGGVPPTQDPVNQLTITSLPAALVSHVAAPSWVNEINLSAGKFSQAADAFQAAVDKLVNEGVRSVGSDTAFIADLV